MKTFIAIVGNRHSGKSTIIRCLTGANTGQFRGLVQDRATNKTIEVIGSSPQEKSLSLADLQKILKRARRSAVCNGVVCAIQPTIPRTRLSMEYVLNEAHSHGFKVYAYILDPDYQGTTGHATSITLRINAAGFTPHVLDGRRFGHINAATINATTRIAA